MRRLGDEETGRRGDRGDKVSDARLPLKTFINVKKFRLSEKTTTILVAFSIRSKKTKK